MNDVTTRVRKAPRISLTKLGEYMTAGAARRRSIVRDQKRPRAVIVARYNTARRAIVDHLAAGGVDNNALIDTIEDLEARSGANPSKWHAQDQLLSVEALDAFLEVNLPLDRWAVRRCPGDPPKLQIGGVQISVRPDLLIRGHDRDGAPWFGAVKVHISKGFPLCEAAAQYTATMLHLWVEQHLATADEPANHAACLVLDVFAQAVWTAPRSNQRRRADVAVACEEIALRWTAA